MSPGHLKYTKDHEWIDPANGRIGITDFAQKQLGDVVYLELPSAGADVTKGEAFGTIESVKAANELFAPVSGSVAEVNAGLASKPEAVNSDPYGSWMVAVGIADAADLDALMTAAQYDEYLGQQ